MHSGHSSLPPFPKPEWKHVLSGMVVNLDTVFSGFFSTLADDKISTSIGDFDLCQRQQTCQNHPIPWWLDHCLECHICDYPLHLSPLFLCFPIVPMNSNSTLDMCFSFSEPFPFPTTKSSILTRPSTATQGKLNTLSSVNLGVSTTSKLVTSRTTELETATIPAKRKRPLSQIADPPKPVASGIVGSVIGVHQNAITDTSVPTAVGNTHTRNVQRMTEASKEYMHPKVAHESIWGAVDDDISPSAGYSFFPEPLPHPPQSKLENFTTNKTIHEHPTQPFQNHL
jgi:hypothetical protein